MKKRTLSFLLALVMCLSLLPMTALAAEGPSASVQTDDGHTVTISLDKSNYLPGETITVTHTTVPTEYPYKYYGDGLDLEWTMVLAPADAELTYQSDENHDLFPSYNADPWQTETQNFTAPSENGRYEIRLFNCSSLWRPEVELIFSISFTVGNVKEGSISLDGTEYTANTTIKVQYSGLTEAMMNAGAFVGVYKAGEGYDAVPTSKQEFASGYATVGSGEISLALPNINGAFEVRLYNSDVDGWNIGEDQFVMSLPITLSGATASEWAVAELERAEELGLIPDCLDGADLTADITRAEFAAVAVKVYEALSGTAAIPAVNNPFTDCNDVEVLKAYNIGAVNGTSATTYDPDALLNREQAATMLTRVFKKISLVGWTLQTDGQFTLPYTKPAAFADDKDISDWAKDSVYFMAANGIINGVGNNKFAPKNVTTEEQATGYANATREQALLIAVRMVENLGS